MSSYLNSLSLKCRWGLQSILWGDQLCDLRSVRALVDEFGFSGVELSQRVRMLPTPSEFKSPKEQQLVIAGLAGGALEDRVSFGKNLDGQLPYLYCDEWDRSRVTFAVEKGFCVALHPHMFKSIDSVARAMEHIGENPSLDLGLIIDTAHVFLAGEDVTDCIQRHSEYLKCVHLKDWSRRFGLSPYRFARGFTPLGDGELGELLVEVLQTLESINYTGWVIIEQDTQFGSPESDIRRSVQWLTGLER